MNRPRLEVFYVLALLTLIALRIVLGAVLRTPFQQLLPFLEKATEFTVANILLILLVRVIFKRIPQGYAGVIWSNNHRSCTAFPAKDYVLVMPWDTFELYDLREKHLDLTFNCVTKDRIRVTIRVSLRWQIEYSQLLAYLNMGVDGPKMLDRLIAAQLVHDTITRTMDEVQCDQRILTFHLERLLGWNPYGARMYGIIVLDPRITSLTFPTDITAAAEQARRYTLEQQSAEHKRLIGYANRLSDAHARAHELLTLDEVMQDITPLTVEFSKILEMAKTKAQTQAKAERPKAE